MPEDLPHLPPKTIAHNRVADPSRRDYPEPWTRHPGNLLSPDQDLKQKNAAIAQKEPDEINKGIVSNINLKKKKQKNCR